MYIRSFRILIALVALFAAGFAPVAASNRPAPELPSPACDTLHVPPGHKVAFRAYAIGVQRYRWDGVRWQFVEPVATLYADAGYHGKIGTHYAGPTWEHNSGDKVIAARREGCSPEPNAIPWLLLEATSNEGPGIFQSVTYIQRVNTVGGVAPSAPGGTVGMIVDVPYTAEYYFYRATH